MGFGKEFEKQVGGWGLERNDPGSVVAAGIPSLIKAAIESPDVLVRLGRDVG